MGTPPIHSKPGSAASRPSAVSDLLRAWGKGDLQARDDVLPLVYRELRRRAAGYLRQERADHTLQPTALIHEAFIRLSGAREARFESRAHFYGAAAHAMRRVLVDYARRRNSLKRGGPDGNAAPFTPIEAPQDARLDVDLVALDEALDKLAAFAPDKASGVELRYFGGLSVEETATYLRVSPATVKRHWTFARAWLLRALGPAETSAAG